MNSDFWTAFIKYCREAKNIWDFFDLCFTIIFITFTIFFCWYIMKNILI